MDYHIRISRQIDGTPVHTCAHSERSSSRGPVGEALTGPITLQLAVTIVKGGVAAELTSLPADERQRPIDGSPSAESQTIWMASSGQALMQCSSLPQSPGRARTATRLGVSRHAGPQASTQSPQPVQSSSITTGSHLRVFCWFTVSSAKRRVRGIGYSQVAIMAPRADGRNDFSHCHEGPGREPQSCPGGGAGSRIWRP
jgi:hypothetical protein